MIHAIHYILFHFVAITSKIFLILIYNVRVEGLENYKKSGEKALIICNHTSFIDALILFCFLPPGTSYAIDVVQFKTPKVRFLSKFIDLYPVNQNEPHSLKSMIKKLKEKESGHIVIFPEGRITTTGGLMKIYDGPSMIIEKTGAKLLPVFIKNAEHTVFSRIRHYTGIQFPIITLQIFEPELVEAPDTYTAKQKRQYFSNRIFDRMKDMKYQSSIKQASIIDSLEESAKIFGPKKEIISDTTDTHLTYKKLISYSKHLSVNIKRQHKEEKNIAILMPNSSATQLAYWSILYSGRTPAMLNINLGFKALLQCCKLANVKTVYTSRLYIHHLKAVPIIQNLSKNGIKIVYVESFRKEFTLKKIIVNKAIQIFSKPIKYKQNDDATILFTTSKRDLYKGVVLTHKNLISNVQQILTVWEINATDRMINVIPNSNSFGLVMGMIMPLMKGVFNYQHPNPLLSKTVAELCYQSSATVLIGTDSLLYRFGLVAHNYDFFNIRYVLCAGEKLRK
ncbi:MAG: acyl-[acyl-carrier-protein]-phospholipid O-acyltransferase, partial [bacterium]